MQDIRFRGSCLCGSTRVATTADPIVVAVCHCTHCQKQAGSAFSTVMIFPAAAVEVTGAIKQYEDTANSGAKVFRRFCPNCGSPVETASAETEQQGIRIIKAGLMDEPRMPAPQIQMFCDSALPWVPDIEGTPRFPAMPPT